MKIIKLLLLMLLLPTLSPAAQATSPLILEEGYIFLPLKGSTVTAGYGTIANTSNEDLEVTLVNAQGFNAAELHETVSKEDMMKMQKVSSVVIKKGSSLKLKPGGSHIMLFDPITELEVGDLVQISFRVKDQNVSLLFPIKSRTEPPTD